MRTETGVMVMKNGKAWGTVYEDGQSHEYGWIDPEEAEIHDPEFCTSPIDVTYMDSPYTDELRSARLVPVRRTITLEIFP